ncbi:hypothetical protein ACFLQZ_05175 [Acidobacteriota bacterium]
MYLKEIIRIKDNGEDIIFRGPENLIVDDNENIYFLSAPHLYKYDKDGNFIFKIIGEGQGPGEADQGLRKHFAIINDDLVVRSISPPKAMIFQLDGILKKEIKLESFRRIEFIGGFEDKIYATQREVSWELKGKSGYIDFPRPIYEFSSDFQDYEKIYSFPVEFYFDKSAWFGQAFLEFAIKDFQNLFVVHTSEYKIVRYNLESKKIEDVITREFNRVKRPKRIKKPGYLYGPDKEYYQDIHKFLVFKDHLWAFTSEKSEEGHWLVDVYDREGRFVDYFFLCFPGDVEPKRYQNMQLITWKDYLFSADQDSEGYYSIAKYKIED